MSLNKHNCMEKYSYYLLSSKYQLSLLVKEIQFCLLATHYHFVSTASFKDMNSRCSSQQ